MCLLGVSGLTALWSAWPFLARRIPPEYPVHHSVIEGASCWHDPTPQPLQRPEERVCQRPGTMLPNAVPVPSPDWGHGPKTPAEKADPFAEIHKRLDQISEKMDRCLAEVAAAAAPTPAAARGAPAPAPKRSNLLAARCGDETLTLRLCVLNACERECGCGASEATVPEPSQMAILPESSEPQRLGSLAARDSRVSSFSLRPSAAFASRPSRT